MKNKLNKRTATGKWSTEFLPLHRSNGRCPPISASAWKIRARSGVNAALLLAALGGLWLAGATLPAQEATNEQTDPVFAPAEPAPDAVPEPSEAATNEVILKANSPSKSKEMRKLHRHGHRGGENAKVVFGKDAEVQEGETVDAVVVIGGNAIVAGKVRDAAVVIGGNLIVRSSGEVGDTAIAVLGSVTLETNAIVHGDAVAVGGAVDVAEGATVEGERQSVDFSAMGLPKIELLRKWFVHCALKLRPLAPQVGWVWVVAGLFFLLYLLAAVALPKPVEACVAELTRRPATTFFMGLLAKILLPLVLIILVATGIGIFIAPFVLAALLFGAIIGKVAFLEYLGFAVQKAFGVTEVAKPVIALVIGSIILAVLYVVPVLGLMTFGVAGLWGLGAAVTAALGSLRRESPEKPAPPPANTIPPAGPAPMPMAMAAEPGSPTSAQPTPNVAGAETAGFAAPTQTAPAQPQVSPTQPASMPEALVYPRAGFWERMGAAFLDVVLLGIVGGVVEKLGRPHLGLLVTLAYFAGMWAWKGTTVGGIVLNLKVVRLDGSPMSFAAALVRGLAAAFSVVVLFLGFLWIAWDKERQGWHDRIAGTVVVRLPRGVPLVCL